MAKSTVMVQESNDGFHQPFHRFTLGTITSATARIINVLAVAAKEVEVHATLNATNGTFNVPAMLEGQTIRFKIVNAATVARSVIFQRNGLQTGILTEANAGKSVSVTASQTWVFVLFFDGVDYRLSITKNWK